MQTSSQEQLIEYLKQSKIGKKIISSELYLGEVAIFISASDLLDVLKFLKKDKYSEFQQLIALCGVDYPAHSPRFEVVYLLLSFTLNHRIKVKVKLEEGRAVPSVEKIYPSAVWYEREVYDMYGIAFSGSSDPRRILTDYGFEGYPLRKDFPLTGHVEVAYNGKEVVYQPVTLQQEFRDFDFNVAWRGGVLPGDEKSSI